MPLGKITNLGGDPFLVNVLGLHPSCLPLALRIANALVPLPAPNVKREKARLDFLDDDNWLPKLDGPPDLLQAVRPACSCVFLVSENAIEVEVGQTRWSNTNLSEQHTHTQNMPTWKLFPRNIITIPMCKSEGPGSFFFQAFWACI